MSLCTQRSQAERVVPLGEADAGCVADQVTMEVRRNAESERSDQEQLARCGLEEIDSSYDFRYLHGCVVDHYGELIGGNVIAPPDDEVAEISASYERL